MLVMLLLFLLLLVLVLVLAVLSDVPHTSPLRALSKVYSSEVRHGKLGTAPGDTGILPPPHTVHLSSLSLQRMRTINKIPYCHLSLIFSEGFYLTFKVRRLDYICCPWETGLGQPGIWVIIPITSPSNIFSLKPFSAPAQPCSGLFYISKLSAN